MLNQEEKLVGGAGGSGLRGLLDTIILVTMT